MQGESPPDCCRFPWCLQKPGVWWNIPLQPEASITRRKLTLSKAKAFLDRHPIHHCKLALAPAPMHAWCPLYAASTKQSSNYPRLAQCLVCEPLTQSNPWLLRQQFQKLSTRATSTWGTAPPRHSPCRGLQADQCPCIVTVMRWWNFLLSSPA